MTALADRYELGRLLGTGAMSDVRLAQDLLLGRQVAVKLFRPGVEPARVRQEVRLHARLSHPGLVTVYDSGTDASGRTFLVLQLVDGPTLAERIRRGPLPSAEATRVGRGVAEALAHLHAHGVVHRDVKPANVLVDADGSPRLADLGIAHEDGQDGLTATGFTLGTVPYLSPEQVRGQGATPASDVWALGLVLLESLTGRREYPGMTAEGALARLTRRPVVDGHLPDPWPGLLAAMTADDPRARPTAAEVAAVLAGRAPAPAVVDDLPETEPVPVAQVPLSVRVPQQRRPATRHARRAAAAAAAVVLGTGALVAVGGSGGPAAPTPDTDVAPVVRPVAVATTPAATTRAPSAAPTVPAVVRTVVAPTRAPATRVNAERATPTRKAPVGRADTARGAGNGKDKGKGGSSGK